MKGLADLGSGLLIIFGIILVWHDAGTGIAESDWHWVGALTQMQLWKWGLASLAAGAFCAALGSLGEQLGTLVWRPTAPPAPAPTLEKPA
jgi:hypothetical protein